MAAEAASPSTGTTSVELDQMRLEQLNQIKQQEEGRLQTLTHRYAQLRQAAARIGASHRAVEELLAASTTPLSETSGSSHDGSSEGVSSYQEILLPLTESLYIPGKIRPVEALLIDLGTGYYVERTSAQTLAHLDRRLQLVDQNSDQAAQAIQACRKNLEVVAMTMQGKMLEIRARREGARHRAAVEGLAEE